MPSQPDRRNDGLQPDMPHGMDWFFTPQTVWCGAAASDFSTTSPVFRALVCVLALLVLAWALYLHRGKGEGFMLSSAQVAEIGLEAPAKPKRERLYHLDYFRTMAVAAVIVDHSGGARITYRNTYGSLQWTQQFLMLISGMAFMMSRSKMGPYVLRLLVITVIGMFANWLGFFIAGGMRVRPRTICVACYSMDDPEHDQEVVPRNPFSLFYDGADYTFTDINFQMGYALLLAAIAVLCRPLKEAIQWRNDNPREYAPRKIQMIAAGYAFLFLLQLCAYVAEPTEGKFYSPCGFTLVMLQMAVVSLVCVYPISDGYGAESPVGWMLLCVMYIPRVVGDVHFKPGHWIDVFLFGLVVQKWPLFGHKKLLMNFKAYGPLALAVLMMAKVDQSGRCDLHVPYYWFERMRFNFGEGWLVIAFCVGALNAQDPHGVSRWLNWWSLCAFPLPSRRLQRCSLVMAYLMFDALADGFCFHRMWYMILPIPYGFAFTLSHMVIFYLLHKKFPPKGNADENAAGDEGSGSMRIRMQLATRAADRRSISIKR